MENKIVPLLSGGLDSSVMLHKLLMEGYDLYPVFFEYEQNNLYEEYHAIENICTHLKSLTTPGVLNNVIPINLDMSFINSPLKDNQSEKLTSINDKDFKETKKNDFVPCRNILFLTHAAAYASSLDTSNLAIGSHKEKLFPYPDSSMEFLDSM